MGDEKEIEGKKESSGQGGGGGTAGEGEKKPSEADALLKAELEESRRELKKLREADEKRTKKELEDQGKFKELLAGEQARNADLLAKIATAERRNELLQTVTAHTTELNKAGLMKMAERIDAETGREKPLAEVLKLAEEEIKSLVPAASKTNAFGSTGGGGGGGKDGELSALKSLHDQAAKGDRVAAGRYTTARAEWIKKHGEPPKF